MGQTSIRLDIAAVCRGMRPVPVLNKASGEFPVGAGGELYLYCRVAKINPMADVPRSDLSRLCEGFKSRCELTDAENPAGYGKGNFVFLQISHHSPPPASRHGE